MASYIKLLIIDDKMYTFINAHSPLLPQTQFLTTTKQTLLNSQFPKKYSPPLLFIHHLYSYIVWEILIPNLTIMIDCMGSSIIHKNQFLLTLVLMEGGIFWRNWCFYVFSGKNGILWIFLASFYQFAINFCQTLAPVL